MDHDLARLFAETVAVADALPKHVRAAAAQAVGVKLWEEYKDLREPA